MIGKNRNEAQKQLRYLNEYLASMGLASEKCLAFEIRKRGKSWLVRDPSLEISGSGCDVIFKNLRPKGSQTQLPLIISVYIILFYE